MCVCVCALLILLSNRLDNSCHISTVRHLPLKDREGEREREREGEGEREGGREGGREGEREGERDLHTRVNMLQHSLVSAYTLWDGRIPRLLSRIKPHCMDKLSQLWYAYTGY